MKKLVSGILVGTLVATMLLSGCSSSSEDKTSSDTSTNKVSEGIQYGQILSVSDSEIVLALGTMDNKAPQGDGSQGGTPPQGNPPSGDNDGTPPSGDNKGNPPSGDNQPPEATTGSGIHGDGFGKSMITLTGDKLTIAVSDKTTIAYMKNTHDTQSTSDTTAKLSDLKEGDIIAITLDEDGKTALEITIMSIRDHSLESTTAAVSTKE